MNEKIILRVSKYNELDPREIQKLLNRGAKIIKSNFRGGISLAGRYGIKPAYELSVIPYSGDNLCICNVQIPLSEGDEDYYSCILEINLNSNNNSCDILGAANRQD